MGLKIWLIAEDSARVRMLQVIAKSDHQLVGIMTSAANGEGRSAAGAEDCPVLPAKLVRDPASARIIRESGADIVFNIYSLYIVAPEILAATRLGAFNMHPGPLPRYAGLNSMLWAMYKGERTHGVTIHKMVPDIDAGPIARQEMFDIQENETGRSLSLKCIDTGVLAGLAFLDQAADPSGIPLTAQDLAKREYFGAEVPQDGVLDWKRPAREVFDFLRACDFAPFASPWGSPRTLCDQREITVLKAGLTGRSTAEPPGSVTQRDGSGVCVACSDELILLKTVKLNEQRGDAGKVLRPGDRLG